jgi:vitamin B12 transporter
MKKEKKVWALTLLAFWSLSPNISNGQQQDSVRTLDEVTITATRLEQPLIEVPRSVSVITRDAIEKSVYNSVGDLLSSEAGIYIVGAMQTPGTNQSIFMRGANSNQVVVMIDGMRITDPSSPNGAIDFSEISLTDVERVEIIRGSHSTLFGGSAIGGAINIITRKGGDTGFHGSALAQAGTYGDKSLAGSANVNLRFKLKNGFYISGSAFRQQVDGLNATEDTISTPRFKAPDKDEFNKADLYFKSGYVNDRWDVFASGKFSDQRADIDDRAYDDDDNAYLDFKRTLIEYSADYKLIEGWKLSFSGSLTNSRRYMRNDSSLVNSDGDYDKTYIDGTYKSKIYNEEIVLNYSGEKLKGVFGGGHYRETMDFQTFYYSNAFGFPFESKVDYDSIDTSANTGFVFGQISVDVNNFNFKAGSRFSKHSRAGNFVTFEFNPSYRFVNTLLYGSISSGFNAPSLYQLFDPSSGAEPSITRGNMNLTSEKSLSMEIGIKKEFNSGSHFTVSAFSSTIDNDIEYVYLWNKSTDVDELGFSDYIGDTYLNISRQVTKGVELSGRFNAGKFYLQGNVTYMDGKITVRPEDISEAETGGHHVQLYNYGSFATSEVSVDRLARRPRFSAYSEAGYKIIPALTIYAAYRRTGSRNDVEYNGDLGPFGALSGKKVQGYDLFDAGLNYQINKHFTVHTRVENLTDRNYREIYGFQTRGRSGYIKFIFKW